MLKWIERWRRKNSRRCVDCGAALVLGRLPEATGQDGSYFARLIEPPILACPNPSHAKRWADPDFGMKFIECVYDSGDFPVARSKVAGIHCRRCARALTAAEGRTASVVGTIRISALPEFQLELVGPVSTCPECGLEQIQPNREGVAELSEALARAFGSSGVQS